MPALRRLAVFVLVAAACGSDPASRSPVDNVAVDRSPVLVPFGSCAELEQEIEDELVLRMRSILDEPGVYFYGLPEVAVADAAPAAAGPSAYTTTNAQVEGVAEADFVQNDGTRIAVVTGDRLHLARSWPPADLQLQSSVRIEGWPHALFLDGARAVVFSAVYVPRELENGGNSGSVAGAAPWVWGGWQTVVKVTTLDVSDLSAPVLTSETYLPGRYVSARRMGDRVRLVTSEDIPFPEGVELWLPYMERTAEEQRAALAERNEAVIRDRSLDDWLRRGTVRRPGEPDVELGYDCTEFSRSSAPVLPGILTISTLDLAAPALVSRTSVLAEPGVVYASARTLYVASQHWWRRAEPGQRDATYVHAFDLADPDRALYAGSGVVDGYVRDQYSLDEHEGALRIVTTVAERVEDGTPWGGVRTAGRLSVLAPEGGALALVGETPEFGADERVFGTRLLGSRGFVITARQIDPLFTFDLSDPTRPTVVGELEMPGFISYLHPVDATHLLGVGSEPAANGGPIQLKIALFDVADLERPAEVTRAIVGEGWGWSEALWDPKAFTWFGARGLLAIPFAEWSGTLTSDLRLFQVDPVTGIVPAGRLSMADVYGTGSGAGWAWYWSPWVRRSILADDYVYAVSDAGIRAARVDGLPDSIRTIEFPRYGTE